MYRLFVTWTLILSNDKEQKRTINIVARIIDRFFFSFGTHVGDVQAILYTPGSTFLSVLLAVYNVF